MIFNHCIALHKRYYRLYHKSLNVNVLSKHLTKLKKLPKYAYWNLLGSQAIQDIAQRIDKGYKLFFRNQKHGIKSAPPSFKKVKKYSSFTLKQAGYKLLPGNKLIVAGQVYSYFKSQEIKGIVKTVTVKRDAVGDIYVFVVCETEDVIVKSRSGKSVGYDFGLKQFLTASDNNDVKSPLFFKQNMKKIRKLSKALSRKKKGSSNRKRARAELVRAHKKVANQRRDYHFKLAKEIANEYALVCLEDLNIKAMQRLWGRKISDLGHSQFVGILRHQCSKVGSQVIQIPRFYPSSKTCFDCSYVLDELPLAVREWTCPACGTTHDRDRNASKVIEKVGTSTIGVKPVRPAIAGVAC